jgi:hypothetical protein
MAKPIYQARLDFKGDDDFIVLTHGSEEVWVPMQSIDLNGKRPSQDNNHRDFMARRRLVMYYEGSEYLIGAYFDLDSDVAEVLLEWCCPT